MSSALVSSLLRNFTLWMCHFNLLFSWLYYLLAVIIEKLILFFKVFKDVPSGVGYSVCFWFN